MNLIRLLFFIFIYALFDQTSFCQSTSIESQQALKSKTKELKNYIKWTINYASQKKFDSANHYAKRALRLSEEINDKNLKAEVVYNNARSLFWQVKIDEAKKLIKQNIDNNKLVDSFKIKSLWLISAIYNYEKNYTEELNAFINIEKIIRDKPILKLNDSVKISEVYLNIGNLHRETKNIKKANDYYDMALLYANDSDFENMIIYFQSDLYEDEDDLHKSINLSLRGIDISNKDKSKVWLPSHYVSISNCYIKLGIADSAIYYGKKGLIDNTDCQLGSLYNNIGKGYMLSKNYQNAINYFEKAIDSSLLELQSLEMHKNMRDAFILTKNYEKAILHNEKYLSLKKSVDSLRIRQELIEITEKYESEKKQLKIEMLQSENNYNALVIRKQNIQLMLIGVSFLVSLAFIGLIIFFYYREKKHKKVLFIKNKQLAQELKNNVNSIISSFKNASFGIDDLQKRKIHTFINKAIQEEFYLNKNISLSSLAKSANTNTTYLSKVINEDFKKTFTVFLNELRISYTLKQLEIIPEYRRFTIDNIADKAGFSSSSAFYNAFKKFTGLTPSYYIKKRLLQE
jgi:AraC-like DNA-binding protein